MPKKPHSKLGRLTLLLIEIWGSLAALAIIVLLVVESLTPINAALWHMRHGNTVTFDGHAFHLPRSWYPAPATVPTQLTLRRAQFGGAGIANIVLAIRPQVEDEQAAANRIESMTANLNQHAPEASDHWTSETLRGRKLTFHCTMSTEAGAAESLVCQAANSNLAIFTITSGHSERADALDIIETSE